MKFENTLQTQMKFENTLQAQTKFEKTLHSQMKFKNTLQAKICDKHLPRCHQAPCSGGVSVFFWWACLKDSGGLSRHISPDLVQASLAADLSTSSPDVHPTSFIPFTTLPPVILTTSISSQQCLHLTTALVKSSWAHKKCEVHWSVKQGKRQKKCNEDMFVSFNVLFNLLGWFNMI